MLTILTPTYNRENTLDRLYKSLNEQSCNNFEWLVVDDGSKDNTLQKVQNYKSESFFTINVYSKSNGGKHSALNTGVNLSNGEWICIVDSDDLLTNNAVESILRATDTLSQEYVGICFRKANLMGEILGTPINKLNIEEILTPTQAGHLYRADLAYVFKKSAMLSCPFPIISGEKFVPELYIWNRISDLGLIKFYSHDYIYLCEYLEDGYSHNFKDNLRKNPKGFSLHYSAQFFREKKIKAKIKCAIRWLQCQSYILRGML
ncbi:TPA: glycosyltransferase family 2 protein [Vibrio vulnificus]|nr:glycosyltransferase family 2 protein [Vibrio vulnificus]HAS8600269.1 glycosyltransferase family 2 protein [Vibrio vulnificus]